MQQTEIFVKSSIDGTMQPSLFYKSPNKGRPLLVVLHTWSYDRFNQLGMVPYAEKYDFNLLLPEFRGANLVSNEHKTDACGSLLAKQDIKDAVEYIKENEDIDSDNIFLLGNSGGGHMTLLMAGYCPELFKCMCAYVPITDLTKWVNENPRYTEHILACCSNSEEEMLKRSPVTYMDKIATANLKICHGKFDPSVPVTQSIDFFNALMEKYPKSRVFLDIFDGGHELDREQAMYWIMSQYVGVKKVKVTG